MYVVSSATLGECWLQCIEKVLAKGCTVRDEDVELLEILGLSISISDPKAKDAIILSCGDERVLSKMLAKFSKGSEMEDRPFTYGQLIYDMFGTDQFEWLVDRLGKKRETKSATIGLLVPGSGAENLPCLCTIDAKIREEKLKLQFFFRSQNIFGRQYANLVAMAMLHEELCRRVGVGIGSLQGYIASAHIYDYDLEEARALCAGSDVRIQDKYYECGPASVRRD